MDYKNMYFQLSAKIADAVELLIAAQQTLEQQYMDEEEKYKSAPDSGLCGLDSPSVHRIRSIHQSQREVHPCRAR